MILVSSETYQVFVDTEIVWMYGLLYQVLEKSKIVLLILHKGKKRAKKEKNHLF